MHEVLCMLPEWEQYISDIFLNCKAVQLFNIHISICMSNGTGAVVYNPVGVINITSCLFSHNGLSGEQEAIYGGGDRG